MTNAARRIKRGPRATKAEMEARYDAVYDIVRANRPTGIRFTFYSVIDAGLVKKDESGATKIQRAILDMRRKGVIPWGWIVDVGRWMRKPSTWDSIEEAIEDCAATYRRALWSQSKTRVEVWCESESVAGVLYPATSKWDVPLSPCKGQPSDTFAYGAAEDYRGDPRALTIVYVGDHDPHGYEIETNLQSKLVRYSGRDDIGWLRLACTADDVANLGLRGSPPKKDTWKNALTGQHERWSGPAIEVEAIPPPTLRQWLDEFIEAHVDHDNLRVLKVAEESEREALHLIARRAS